MKKEITDFVLGLGVDDVGFAAAANYNSPRSPRLEDIMPEVKTMIVMAIQEVPHYESPNNIIKGMGRMDTSSFARQCCYRLAKYIYKKYKAKAYTLPSNYPMDMSKSFMGEVSMRHAAIAAGLGVFGRHNLVIHPELGTQVLYYAVLTDLEIEPDLPLTEELCTECDLCVENCPAQALDKEHFTDAAKCIKVSQPYGLSSNVRFWMKLSQASKEEQLEMLRSQEFMNLTHVESFGGTYYVCFQCYAGCPACKTGG